MFVFLRIGKLFQQILQTLRCFQEFNVTFGTRRIPASKLPVDEALHVGNVSVSVTHPAANKATTACDRDRRFLFAEEAFYFWRGLTVPMLSVVDPAIHCLSFWVM
jgi:hypothetical protein